MGRRFYYARGEKEIQFPAERKAAAAAASRGFATLAAPRPDQRTGCCVRAVQPTNGQRTHLYWKSVGKKPPASFNTVSPSGRPPKLVFWPRPSIRPLHPSPSSEPNRSARVPSHLSRPPPRHPVWLAKKQQRITTAARRAVRRRHGSCGVVGTRPSPIRHRQNRNLASGSSALNDSEGHATAINGEPGPGGTHHGSGREQGLNLGLPLC